MAQLKTNDDDKGLISWAMPAIITALLSLGAGAFIEQQSRIKDMEIRLRSAEQRIDRLESADYQSKYERDELRHTLEEIKVRQDRVIAALSAIDPKIAGTILRNP